MQKFLKEKGVHHFSTFSELKASIVERFNRTLKQKMWKYLTQNNTLRYVDVSDQLVCSCNHTFHRSIGMTPSQVNDENEEFVWHTLYDQTLPKVKPNLKKETSSGFPSKHKYFQNLICQTGQWNISLFIGESPAIHLFTRLQILMVKL